MKIRTVITNLTAWNKQVAVIADEPEQLLTPEERDAMVLQISNRARSITEKFIDNPKSLHSINVQKFIRSYPDKTIIAIHGYITPELSDRNQERERMEFILSIPMMQNRVEDGISICEYLELLPSIRMAGIRVSLAFKIIRVLHKYPQLPATDDYSDADARTKQKIMSILTAAALMHDIYEEESRNAYGARGQGKVFELSVPLEVASTVRITDGDLVSLIIDRPGQAAAIIDIYRERGSDADVVRGMLDSAAQPLREGWL